MQTLQVLNFTPSKCVHPSFQVPELSLIGRLTFRVMAHPRVIEWYKTLLVNGLDEEEDVEEVASEDGDDDVEEVASGDDDQSDSEVYEDAPETMSSSDTDMDISSD